MVQHTNEEAENQDFIPFAMIPTWLLRSGGKLSSNAVMLYGVIMTYADNVTREAFPSRETLAEDMGVSVATVKRAIKELEQADVIHVKRVRTEKGGNFRSNQYTLASEPPWVTDAPREGVEASPWVTDDPPPWGNDDSRPWVTDDPITRPTLTKPNSSKENPVLEVPLSSEENEFFGDEEIGGETPTATRRLRSADHKFRADKKTISMLRDALGKAG